MNLVLKWCIADCAKLVTAKAASQSRIDICFAAKALLLGVWNVLDASAHSPGASLGLVVGTAALQGFLHLTRRMREELDGEVLRVQLNKEEDVGK